MQAEFQFFYWIPLIYLCLIQFVAIISMWWDKRKAGKREWRVAEATLLIIAFVGGAFGILLGMFRFRHKTQKRAFQMFVALGLFVSLVLSWLFLDIYI